MIEMNWKYLLALPLSVAGCASPHTLVKHGSTPEEYDRGLARCRYEAVAATAGYSSGRVAPTMGGAIAQGLGEGMAIGLRQSELFALCLQAAGYTKQIKSNGPPAATASLPVSVAAPQPVARPDAAATKGADPAATNDEMARVVQLLADRQFPLVGTPVRFLKQENRSYYEAWGTGGRLTHVVCENGACRSRSIYD